MKSQEEIDRLNEVRENQIKFFRRNIYAIRGACFTLANRHSGLDLYGLCNHLKAVCDACEPFLPPKQ